MKEQHQIRAKLQDPGSMDEVPSVATQNSSVTNSCGVEQKGEELQTGILADCQMGGGPQEKNQ